MSAITPARFPFLLFDLDGTLTESGPGITGSIAWTFRQMGLEPGSPQELRRFIGPPLRDSLRDFRGMSEEEADRFIRLYRDRYETVGVLQSDPYPGIPALLEDLHRAGYTLLTATSKLREVALQVLEHYSLVSYFAYVGGGDPIEGQDKPSVIRRTLKTAGAAAPKSLMIGDRKYDILGAKANRVTSMGVLYGYGDRSELQAAGADYIAESVADLRRLLL